VTGDRGLLFGEATGPVLRVMTPTDVPAVAELERVFFGPSAWSEAMVAGELHASGRWYLAAVEDGEVLGYAGLWFDGDVTQVMTIGVAPAVQRQGIGSALLTALIRRSRELGASAVLLEVRVDNAPALAMYERFGFTLLARRRRYYQPEDVDAWTMRMELTADGDLDGEPDGGLDGDEDGEQSADEDADQDADEVADRDADRDAGLGPDRDADRDAGLGPDRDPDQYADELADGSARPAPDEGLLDAADV
jgi:ribosomal-protein-alanine N-acetyltransferase